MCFQLDVERKQMNKERALTPPNCHFCNKPLHYRFVDMMLLSDAVQETVEKSPQLIPTYICDYCFLVQIDSHRSTDLIEREYSTSYSPVWFYDIQEFAQGLFKRMEPTAAGFAVELNNHTIQTEQRGILPIANLTKKNVYSIIEMYGKSNRITCHNEMAYSADINDFVAAIKLLLAPEGTITMEFPHLLGLLESEKFTHVFSGVFTYFSFTTIDIIFMNHQLVIYNVEDCLPEGCIRISAKHQENRTRSISQSTPSLRGRERDRGMSSLVYYLNFKGRMERLMKSCKNV